LPMASPIIQPWPLEGAEDWKVDVLRRQPLCSRVCCENRATELCPGCRIPGLSFACRSAYCSKDCQVSDWNERHKRMHVMCKARKRPCRFEETVILTLLELEARGQHPLIGPDGRFSVLFAGARDEGMMDFDFLLSLLKELVYPDVLTKLRVVLCGKQAALYSRPYADEGVIEVVVHESLVEEAYCTAAALRAEFNIIYIIAPGFTDNLIEWDPAINLMLDATLPVVVTSYSNLECRDNDSLFDDSVMVQYFRARSIVGQTMSCMFEPMRRGALGHKNRAYSVFCGRDDSLPVTLRFEFMRQQTILYLRYMAECYSDSRFQHVADMLLSGAEPYREDNMGRYIDMANRL